MMTSERAPLPERLRTSLSGDALYPQGEDDDWANVAVEGGKSSHPLPVGCLYFQVDRLLEEVLNKLEALIKDQPLPDYSVPKVKFDDPYSKEVDFFLAWDKDDNGRAIRTGLTFEESEEFERLRETDFAFRVSDEGRQLGREDSERLRHLNKKHEEAQLLRERQARGGDRLTVTTRPAPLFTTERTAANEPGTPEGDRCEAENRD